MGGSKAFAGIACAAIGVWTAAACANTGSCIRDGS